MSHHRSNIPRIILWGVVALIIIIVLNFSLDFLWNAVDVASEYKNSSGLV